jgi:hypothetical protein
VSEVQAKIAARCLNLRQALVYLRGFHLQELVHEAVREWAEDYFAAKAASEKALCG